MRYADISSPTGVDIPAVPSLPLALRPGFTGQDFAIPRTDEPKEDVNEVEKRLLDDDDFDPDACEEASYACAVALNENAD